MKIDLGITQYQLCDWFSVAVTICETLLWLMSVVIINHSSIAKNYNTPNCDANYWVYKWTVSILAWQSCLIKTFVKCLVKHSVLNILLFCSDAFNHVRINPKTRASSIMHNALYVGASCWRHTIPIYLWSELKKKRLTNKNVKENWSWISSHVFDSNII